jgi:HlyD family secretion protein
MHRRTLPYLAGATVVVALLLGWAFSPRPVEVELAVASRGRFEATVDEDGRTRLRDRFVVSAPLAGRLSRIALRAGDAVEADAPIATLTPSLAPMLDERTLREQQARVEVTDANLMRAAARIERSKVALELARAELRRTEQLAAQGFVSGIKLDSDRLGVVAAQRELDASVAEHHAAGHELEQARAALLAVRQAGGVGGAGARGFTVRAPVAGRVLRVVQASEGSVALGAPLIELGDVRRLEIVAELLTTDALRTRPGDRVLIERWGGPTTLEGRVRQVEPAAFTKVSALGVEEQRVNVLVDIASPPEQWQALGDGFRVSLRIVVIAVDDALGVPVSAVFPQPGEDGGPSRMAVFTVADGRARTTPVEVGARNGIRAWIKGGIEPGAAVIVYPPAAVRDGVRVKARSG